MKSKIQNTRYKVREVGAISILILVFGVVASLVIGGLVVSASIAVNNTRRNVYHEQALAIAEAGVNYYKWHIAHDSSDYQDGTGQPGPYEHEYKDASGNVIGRFSLDISAPVQGSTIFTVQSTGWTVEEPGIKRTIKANYGIPSLARYAFLHNANAWFGQGITVEGPVLSNGGIRQDGYNTSTLKTSKSTYICGMETGCEPSEVKPGIWGKGGPSNLWEFPVTWLDFDLINVDFAGMKLGAQNSGLYLGPSGQQGYHFKFLSDGTFQVYQVTATDMQKGWSVDFGCENLYQVIKTETLLGSYQVAQKPIIFAEDNLWVEGTLNGITTVVAARFPIDSYQMNIWLPNNMVYLDRSGAHRLGLIAQHDIVFTKDVPDDFEVDGALLSQSARVIRHHYNYHSCKEGNPAMKNSLTIYGSVISNLTSFWNYSGGGSEQPTSGFVKRYIIYDPNLFYQPPPWFPSSGVVELISWDEVKNP